MVLFVCLPFSKTTTTKTEGLIQAKYQANDWDGSCQQQARDHMKKDSQSEEEAMQWMEDLAKCVETNLADDLIALNEEISLQAKDRIGIAGALENYTCADPNAPGSPDVTSHIWENKNTNGGEQQQQQRLVHVKHDRAASKIHVVDNFISEDECHAMELAASKSLHKATVADGKGGSRLSEHRKAMQAGISVPWHTADHPIAKLSRRVYDYTNHVMGMEIDEHGQEDLMSIQYFGRGRDDAAPDRYTPVSFFNVCLFSQYIFSEVKVFFSPYNIYIYIYISFFLFISPFSIATETVLACLITLEHALLPWLSIVLFPKTVDRLTFTTRVYMSNLSRVLPYSLVIWTQRQE